MFIALTGGIGCGKSAALAAFANSGFITADADKICHEFYKTPEGIKVVGARWPSVIAEDGSIDRRKLGNIVFRVSSMSAPAARRRNTSCITTQISNGANQTVAHFLKIVVSYPYD